VPTDPVLTALLVEDDARLAALTAEYLGGHGVLVTCTGDGAAGLEEASRRSYDVVLLDLMLPGKHGLEVCRELRSRSDVPIVILTARGEEADRVTGLELGADDYLAKPFSPRELLARIRAVVRRARGQVGPSVKPVRVGFPFYSSTKPLHGETILFLYLGPFSNRPVLDRRIFKFPL
jgi:DNA-binding response OmpR family regulator